MDRAGFRAFPWVALALASLAASGRAEDETERLRYIEALRQNGFAQLAVEYIETQLERTDLSDEQRASLEFEIAATMIAASENEDSLGDREKRLEEARRAFGEFVRKHPDHPRRPESLFQLATIDLQMGRLRIIEAQLPANEGRARELAEQGREFFRKASEEYAEADRQISAALAQLPAFLHPREERDKYRFRERLFEQQIEARFQAALATFFLADSFATIDYRDQDPTHIPEYRDNIQKALAVFESIHDEHRRELVGLYGHLWLARCLAALGDHGRAMGIYNLLVEHDNRALEPFQREVFHFRVLSMYNQGNFKDLAILADDWLKRNARYRLEWAYQGTQLVAARAHIALGKAASDERDRRREFREADRLLELLARYPNSFSGAARREQIALARLTDRSVEGNSFSELSTIANAKLDELKPDMTPEARAALLADVIAKFQAALRAAKPRDDPEEVGGARLSLAYAYLQNDDLFATAVVGESIARYSPKLSQAPEAGMFALSAYAKLYDDDRVRRESGEAVDPEIDAAYMVRIGSYIIQRWPRSSQADEARIVLGKLEYSKRRYEEAARLLDSVNPKSVNYKTALSLAGGSYWEQYKALARDPEADDDAKTALRDKALDRLSRASAAMRKGDPSRFDRERFLNDAIYAEALYDAGDDKTSLDVLAPLVERLTAGDLPEQIEPELRISALVTAMQTFVRTNRLGETEDLVNLLSEQKGSQASIGVTAVFLNLAKRLRDQLERLRALGRNAEADQMVASFDAFLDRVAGREAGQTVQSLAYLGDTYLEIGRYDKAVALFEKAERHPDAAKPESAPALVRARLLTAKALSRKGDHAQATERITALLRDNVNSRDVILARGEILEAAGDFPNAIKHWQWFVDRLKRVEPRPIELYDATERLSDAYIKASKNLPGEQRKQALRLAYRFPVYLLETDVAMPADWRERFQKKAEEILSMLGT
jgi:outer membrane protein assembly factor BamD (BamD/ComL family)